MFRPKTFFRGDGSISVKTRWLLVVSAYFALSALLYMCKQERPRSQEQACITEKKYSALTSNFSVLCLLYFNPYPTAFPYGNGMVLHFYQQQESSTTKTVHKVINRGLKAYV